MKKLVSTLTAILGISTLAAQDVVVKGPDEKLQLAVFVQNETKPCYSVSYNGKTMLEKSPLGMNTNIGDFTKNLKLTGHSKNRCQSAYKFLHNIIFPDIPSTRSILFINRHVSKFPTYITVPMN